MMGNARGVAVLIAALATIACSSTGGGNAGSQAHEGLNAVLWARSAEYVASAEQAFALARGLLDEALLPENAEWTAAVEQEGGDYQSLPPAVIVDVDDAILDTSEFQAELVRNREDFDAAHWNAWVREARAVAIPGALEFARHAAERGVSIYYVTNRSHEVEEFTRLNLTQLGFPVDAEGVNLLSKDEQEDWGSDKTARRAVVARGHRVLLIIGDDLNDFISGGRSDPEQRVALAGEHRQYWGSRWVLLPNQIYGTWERALYDFDETLTRREILQRKWEALRGEN